MVFRGYLTQHPLYFLLVHSRARFCAFSSWDEDIGLATKSLCSTESSSPDDAAILNQIRA